MISNLFYSNSIILYEDRDAKLKWYCNLSRVLIISSSNGFSLSSATTIILKEETIRFKRGNNHLRRGNDIFFKRNQIYSKRKRYLLQEKAIILKEETKSDIRIGIYFSLEFRGMGIGLKYRFEWDENCVEPTEKLFKEKISLILLQKNSRQEWHIIKKKILRDVASKVIQGKSDISAFNLLNDKKWLRQKETSGQWIVEWKNWIDRKTKLRMHCKK